MQPVSDKKKEIFTESDPGGPICIKRSKNNKFIILPKSRGLRFWPKKKFRFFKWNMYIGPAETESENVFAFR